mmetsp:Transcript_4571/g.8906  ORF Transcript_4571/g.8906 Transcript_4571/m.8906 type:complete len:395 (-) Transcript_4571:105-1289(-)
MVRPSSIFIIATHLFASFSIVQTSEEIPISKQKLKRNLSRSLLSFINEGRSSSKLWPLQPSKYGNAVSAKFLKLVVSKQQITSSYDFCRGKSAHLVGYGSSVQAIYDYWINEVDLRAIVQSKLFRYTGGSAMKINNRIYAVQVFCTDDMVKKLALEYDVKKIKDIRQSILSYEIGYRMLQDLSEFIPSPMMDKSAQKSAEIAAMTEEGVNSIENKEHCKGIGGEIYGNHHSAFSIYATWKRRGYLESPAYRYTGLGIAVRNDARIFAVQIFCSADWPLSQPHTYIYRTILRAEWTKQKLLGLNIPREDQYLKKFAGMRSNTLSKYGTLMRNPISVMECETFREIKSSGENTGELIANLFRNGSHVIFDKRWVRTGVGVSRDFQGIYYAIQIFCT